MGRTRNDNIDMGNPDAKSKYHMFSHQMCVYNWNNCRKQ